MKIFSFFFWILDLFWKNTPWKAENTKKNFQKFRLYYEVNVKWIFILIANSVYALLPAWCKLIAQNFFRNTIITIMFSEFLQHETCFENNFKPLTSKNVKWSYIHMHPNLKWSTFVSISISILSSPIFY